MYILLTYILLMSKDESTVFKLDYFSFFNFLLRSDEFLKNIFKNMTIPPNNSHAKY